jgi:hypothetical protein
VAQPTLQCVQLPLMHAPAKHKQSGGWCSQVVLREWSGGQSKLLPLPRRRFQSVC